MEHSTGAFRIGAARGPGSGQPEPPRPAPVHGVREATRTHAVHLLDELDRDALGGGRMVHEPAIGEQ